MSSAATYALTYPAATLDKSQARLTHRVHLDDTPVEVPASGWNYDATGSVISLASGPFVANDIYEFSYTAKAQTVNGIGLAAGVPPRDPRLPLHTTIPLCARRDAR